MSVYPLAVLSSILTPKRSERNEISFVFAIKSGETRMSTIDASISICMVIHIGAADQEFFSLFLIASLIRCAAD